MFQLPWNRKKESPRPAPPPLVQEPPEEPDTTPDSPIPFGYKTGWLCVKSDHPPAVMEVLGLRDAAPCNWECGLELAGRGGNLFVSPALDGWVLVVGWIEEDLANLSALAQKFPRLMFFASHRVVDYAAWASFEDGKLLRAYAYAGDEDNVLWDEGPLTPEEIGLGAAHFPRKGVNWDEAQFPDEETVIALSAAWGVDPGFSGKEYPPQLGWVCRCEGRTM